MIKNVKDRVHSQREALPALYGDVDFSTVPERLTLNVDDKSALPAEFTAQRPAFLADRQTVDLIRTTTMLGDAVADAYGALIPEYGLKRLTTMLKTACRQGIDAVPDAPVELKAFLADMERKPDWLDMDLVAEGARHDRITAAYFMPFIVRGAFLGTFMNSYAALPMALTGALSGTQSAHRVKETASFACSTIQPGGLERHGPGFEAAAMVRLMHSMVRYNALRRSQKWDVSVYGIPIPQIDQVPAGLAPIYPLAARALAQGRNSFTLAEQGEVELCRYRCFLLGLPEELLPDTPDGVVRLMQTRRATLRYAFDDAISGALVRATMAADLRPDHSWRGQLFGAVEHSWSRNYFVRTYAGGDRARAETMGVDYTRADRLRCLVTAPYLLGRLLLLRNAERVPLLRSTVDRVATRMLNRRLRDFGHAEYTTDAASYAGTAVR